MSGQCRTGHVWIVTMRMKHTVIVGKIHCTLSLVSTVGKLKKECVKHEGGFESVCTTYSPLIWWEVDPFQAFRIWSSYRCMNCWYRSSKTSWKPLSHFSMIWFAIEISSSQAWIFFPSCQNVTFLKLPLLSRVSPTSGGTLRKTSLEWETGTLYHLLKPSRIHKRRITSVVGIVSIASTSAVMRPPWTYSCRVRLSCSSVAPKATEEIHDLRPYRKPTDALTSWVLCFWSQAKQPSTPI
jgi:hypothetical protein